MRLDPRKCDEIDFVSYKKPSVLLVLSQGRDVPVAEVAERCLRNKAAKAVVCVAPDLASSFSDLLGLLKEIRKGSAIDFVVYTDQEEGEVSSELRELGKCGNVIAKFGRAFPGRPPRFDPVLGTILDSDNQYAKRIG